jgi:1,4-dihydroxy-6-naphthoate synthase
MKLSISPCPNDTFMFDALLHGRVDTEGLEFRLHTADIEALNGAALRGEADVTKISYAVVPAIEGAYRLLNAGSALGRGNGPLLVAARPLDPGALRGLTVAVPGERTTANLLLKNLFPEIGATKEYLFSEVADAVVRGEADAGVLIHEGRFTYAARGLHRVVDLGREWEDRYALPLPLGAIAVRRSLPEPVARRIDRVLRRSIEHALAHPDDSYDFVKSHARELDDRVIRSHIELFVNRFSLDPGDEGRAAVLRLLAGRLNDPQGVFL